jgi:hypothetical protein
MTRTQSFIDGTGRLALLAPLLLALAACGGSGGGTTSTGDPAAGCVPGDPATAEECGIVYVAMTDADGDFVSYTVDVVSLTLEKAGGAVVETLPNAARLDFADYVELTELVSAASVPPGTYVAGTITIDYGDAEIFVESAGEAVAATAVDGDGNPLARAELRIELADRDRLVVSRGVPSLLTVDFDLEASHTVDLLPTPVEVTVEPFIVAEVEPVDEKEIRVRGPLVSVDVDTERYTIDLRPFHRRDGDFGEVPVLVTDETEYEVDGEAYSGGDGLRALEAAGAGTATAAFGTLDTAAREFTAARVLAGSSVPGVDYDAVQGHVIARSGDQFTVLGATVIPTAREAYFRDRVLVTVGPDTRVFRNGAPDETLDIGDISVGQKVTVLGSVTADGGGASLAMDATEGGVRLAVTRLAGTVNGAVTGQVNLDLATIGGRPVRLFDFAGTGPVPDSDADPADYEIATGDLAIGAGLLPGTAARAFGFPARFGFAPPDFEARTVIDPRALRAKLAIRWGPEGATAPFAVIGPDALVPDTSILGEDQRHYIRVGPRIVDILDLEGGISIVPVEEGRTLYSIRTGDSIALYRDFADFADALARALDGASAARALHAHGRYDGATGEFVARKIGILLTAAD